MRVWHKRICRASLCRNKKYKKYRNITIN